MRKASLLATAMMATGATALARQAQPNVLFISIDDLRPELACYGSPQVKTPRIDRLASQGVVFERACCRFGSGDAVVTDRFKYTSYNGGKAEMLHDLEIMTGRG